MGGVGYIYLFMGDYILIGKVSHTEFYNQELLDKGDGGIAALFSAASWKKAVTPTWFLK